ncbi:MAG TPA: hypothetical protein VH302_04440 [Bryobacteraceae bacterium]|nr:hypothetical protein [Bryobacteraceae bacterium]
MQTGTNPPRSVRLCNLMVGIAARLVPTNQRAEFQREWLAEIWHRWQFLAFAGFWNNREALGLFRTCLGVFPDAIWHFALQDPVREKVRSWTRSPWTCLGAFGAVLLLIAVISGGFPATRQVLLSSSASANQRLVFIWFHPNVGGPDKELPSDVPAAWRSQSKLLESVAGFHVSRLYASATGSSVHPKVIETEAALFKVLGTAPALGSIPSDQGAILTARTWKSAFHSDPEILRKEIRIGKDYYHIRAVLPSGFDFLTRQPSVFLVSGWLPERVDVVARSRPGVTEPQLDRELVRISEDAVYYFFRSQLRMSWLEDALWTPVRLFTIAVCASAFLCLWAAKVRPRQIRSACHPMNRKPAMRRALFFSSKVALALVVAFVAGLEWARSPSAILLASRDPASGPFLLWLYILAAMGIFFWAVADQRARCRVCLRLLCFPVRIGCPGCLLLDWSGTELLCTEGHGVLHVPHMSASWEEESQRWISLDESWKDLFIASE